LKFKLAASRW